LIEKNLIIRIKIKYKHWIGKEITCKNNCLNSKHNSNNILKSSLKDKNKFSTINKKYHKEI